MPLPTQSDVHVNRPLTNISIAHMQDANNFIASQVFPIIPVQKQSDAYFSYDNAYWNKDEMQQRAAGAETAGNGYSVDGTSTYYAKPYGFHKDVPDQVRANADDPINLDREATLYVTQKALIKREKLWSTAYMAGAVWTYDYDGVSGAPGANEVRQWSDYTNSDPIADVWAGKTAVLQRTGFEPNRLVLGWQVYEKLVNHPDMIDRIKAGQTPGGAAVITATDLAQVFKVEQVLVMRAIENTAAEGATKSHSFIGGKKAMLVYRPPAPGLMTPSGGYIFSWTGYIGAGPEGQRIKRFRMEALASDRVEIEIAFDMKLISADLGAFWDTVVA
jgi:hypothetical protein